MCVFMMRPLCLMNDPRKIRHIFPYDPRQLGQTFERWAESQLERWPLAAVQESRLSAVSTVHVIGPQRRTRRAWAFDIVENLSLTSGPRWRDWGDDWSTSLERTLARLGPDDVCVIHLNGYAAARLAHRAARRSRVVIVFHGRGLGPFDEHLSTADRLVVLREDAADELLARGARPGQVAVLRPSVDRSRFCPEAHPTEHEPLQLGFVGRLEPSKGVLEIPLVLARFAASGVAAHAQLVGPVSTEQRAAFDEAAKRAGVLDRVEILGELPGANLAERMRSWALLLLPSYTEGHPLVALEACASALPVAAIAGVLPAELERRPGVSVSSRERYPELVSGLLSDARRAPADPWVQGHEAAAAEWDALLSGLPPWQMRPIPRAPRLGRARRLRPPRRFARAVLRRRA